ncbi:MAG: protein kinase [Phycisphaerales bacterium]|nr:protein kinase [Phycisphaerales bacterium]
MSTASGHDGASAGGTAVVPGPLTGAERMRVVMDVFVAVVGAGDEERTRLLDLLTAGEPGVRADVEAMLRADGGTGTGDSGTPGALKTGGGLGLAHATPMTSIVDSQQQVREMLAGMPRLSGHYRIIRVLGEGGMGVVYLAEQSMPRRAVALKALRSGLASVQLLQRLVREAEILGRLHHPGIAQIYEAGVVETGSDEPGSLDQTYLVMEYVDGLPLTAHARTAGLDVRPRVELIARLCDAVQHAHSKGVIHRDLKPGNVLVTSSGDVKVLDFGIARATVESLVAGATFTTHGQILGTLGYMSPEQLDGDGAQIDAGSDVYALGVMLYELLAGRLPFDLAGRSLTEAVTLIRSGKAPALSQADKRLGGDLELIVQQAMHADKPRRYSSAAAMGEDLRRYLAGLPISARADSAVYVLGKLARRRPGMIALLMTAVLALVAFGMVSLVLSQRSAQLARVEAAGRERADMEAGRLRRSLYSSRIGHAQAALSLGDAGKAQRLLEECPTEQRGWEWAHLAMQADRSVWSASVTGDDVISALSRDGATIVAAAGEDVVQGIDAATGDTLWRGPKVRGVPPVVITSDSKFGVVLVDQAEVGIFELRTGVRAGTIRHADDLPPNAGGIIVRAMAASPTGPLVAVAGRTGRVEFFKVPSGERVRTLETHRGDVMGVAFSGDGKRLATVGLDRFMRVWDLETGTKLAERRGTTGSMCVDFSPDGSRVAYSDGPGRVVIWTRPGEGDADGAGSVTIEPPTKARERLISALRFSPDGTMLAVGGRDRLMSVYDARTGVPISTQIGEPYYFRSLSFSADSGSIVSSGAFSRVRRWDARPRSPVPEVGPCFQLVRSISVVDTGTRPLLLVGCLNAEATLVDPVSLAVVRRVGLPKAQSLAAGALSDGRIALATTDGRLAVFGPESDTPQLVDTLGKRTDAAHLEKGGAVFGGRDGELLALDSNLSPIARWHSGLPIVHLARIHPAKRLVAVANYEPKLRLWSLDDTSKPLRELDLGRQVMGMAFSPDGERVAAVGEGGAIRVWSTVTGKLVSEPKGQLGPMLGVAFMPDGQRLVTIAVDRTMRLWLLETGEEILSLQPADTIGLTSLSVSPDGKTIFTGEVTGEVRLWESVPPAR